MARYATDRLGRIYVDHGMGFMPLGVAMVNPSLYTPIPGTIPMDLGPLQTAPGITELTEVPFEAAPISEKRATTVSACEKQGSIAVVFPGMRRDPSDPWGPKIDGALCCKFTTAGALNCDNHLLSDLPKIPTK